MRLIAKNEGIDPAYLRKQIAGGGAVILKNKNRHFSKICAVGKGLKTKINANIGTSPDKDNIAYELKKLDIAIRYGADTVMDLSTGGELAKIRKMLIAKSSVPFGTVPIYEAAASARRKHADIFKMTPQDMLNTLKTQAAEGVDFFTIHCGVTRSSIAALKKSKRILGIVSRGGAILAQWMAKNKTENPFYENFDKVLEIARDYDIALSLGDGMRPGAIADASDNTQFTELRILGELAKRARQAGVSVIIEGPGHLPLNHIEKNVRMEKEICGGAPFYVLGPLVTDIAPGYDHITGAIGGALAASLGADFLCYVTPAEHLCHPSIEDVKDGVIASRIAAHAADIVKLKNAKLLDNSISKARNKRIWDKQISLSVDPVKAKEYRNKSKPKTDDVCTMCGEYCSIKLMEKCRIN